MAEKYIGIENEITSFRKSTPTCVLDFDHEFGRFINKADYRPSSYEGSTYSVRTISGNEFYVDGKLIEIVTPPIAINKGFATRLTDILIAGRNRIVSSNPETIHTGYSMHWNITRGIVKRDSFCEGISVPFSLFGLTPLSIGFGICQKDRRYQLAGDSLPDEQQINATALLLGAYSYSLDYEGSSPIKDTSTGGISNMQIYLPDGRNSTIEAYLRDKYELIEISAQKYLELFYHWVKPIAKSLGTKKEVQNLEGYIYCKKELETDKHDYYGYILRHCGHMDGIYYPIEIPGAAGNTLILKADSKTRKVPLEGKLIGEYVRHIKRFKVFEWEHMCFSYRRKDYDLRTIKEIYNTAKIINPKLPKFRQPLDLHIAPNDTAMIAQKLLAKNKK